MALEEGQLIPLPNAEIETSRCVGYLRDFLDVLAKICFKYYRLPSISVEIKEAARKLYFTFERWQINFLRHILVCIDTKMCTKVATQAILIPLFMRLNLSLRLISYFPADNVLAYEVDWKNIL
jgi:hypothetical protein